MSFFIPRILLYRDSLNGSSTVIGSSVPGIPLKTHFNLFFLCVGNNLEEPVPLIGRILDHILGIGLELVCS